MVLPSLPAAEMSAGTGRSSEDPLRMAEQEVELAARRTLDALQRWLVADNATLAHSQAWLETARRREAEARERLARLRAGGGRHG